jgi:hypothetical protein
MLYALTSGGPPPGVLKDTPGCLIKCNVRRKAGQAGIKARSFESNFGTTSNNILDSI